MNNVISVYIDNSDSVILFWFILNINEGYIWNYVIMVHVLQIVQISFEVIFILNKIVSVNLTNRTA